MEQKLFPPIFRSRIFTEDESFLTVMSDHIEILPLYYRIGQTPPNEATMDEVSLSFSSTDLRIPLLHQTPPTEAAEHEIGQGSKPYQFIEIKETNGHQTFDEKFEDLKNSSFKSTTIFKVNVGLRESNPDAYTPNLISIGPYHNTNPKLGSMEEYKLLYLQRFLGRKSEIDVETWITLLGNFEDEALKCYDGLGNHNSRRFLEMLLLDGCFVVEFIRECCHIEPRDANDQIINAEWMMNQVCRDMLLLENQLPFFILTKLHDMTNHKHPTENFFYMVKSTFSDLFPKKMTYRSEIEDEKFDHLLHVVHRLCSPSKKKIPTTNGSKQSDQCCKISFCGNTLQISKDIPSFSFWESFQIPSVTELHQAGVSFSKLGNLEEDSTTLFDIKFNRGLMEAPCFVATNTFEIFMRNLIAYEQHSSKIFPKYFSHYALLMTQLINSRKDVSLLREKEIILNGLGSDEEVASIFNKLAIGVHLVPSDFSYAEECSNMIQHCKIPWNQMKANLRHNYFNSPWVGASTVAAIILLILTVVQTVLAFIGEVKK